MSPRAFTPNQSRQLLALLGAGAFREPNATPDHMLSWFSTDVLKILEAEQLVGHVDAQPRKPWRQWYLTVDGEAEARAIARRELQP